MLIDLPVDNPETLEDMCVSVFDEDKYGKDESLGKCTIPVQVLRTAITSGQTQVQRLLFFYEKQYFWVR
jgi:ribose 5-phosphate isomerase